MDAAYVFRVRFRLDPVPGVRVTPDTFETTMERAATTPGDSGWLFFRDSLWRGELNDDAHQQSVAASALDVPVESVEFRELRTDGEYLDALDDAIAAELDTENGTFGNAESVERVKTNYFGSSIHVRSRDD